MKTNHRKISKEFKMTFIASIVGAVIGIVSYIITEDPKVVNTPPTVVYVFMEKDANDTYNIVSVVPDANLTEYIVEN